METGDAVALYPLFFGDPAVENAHVCECGNHECKNGSGGGGG